MPEDINALKARCTIPGFKGMHADMTCLGFRYQEGSVFHTDKPAVRCRSGFHYCGLPLNVWDYYDPGRNNRFFSVLAEPTDEDGMSCHDTKSATQTLYVQQELTVEDLIEEHCGLADDTHYKPGAPDETVVLRSGVYVVAKTEYWLCFAVADGPSSAAVTTGCCSMSAVRHMSSAALTRGHSSIALAVNVCSYAKAAGPRSCAVVLNEGSKAETSGVGSVASAQCRKGVVVCSGDCSVGILGNGIAEISGSDSVLVIYCVDKNTRLRLRPGTVLVWIMHSDGGIMAWIAGKDIRPNTDGIYTQEILEAARARKEKQNG